MSARLWIGSHKTWIAEAVTALIVIGFLVTYWIIKRKPSKLNTEHCDQKWHEAQSLCRNQATWPLAIISADKLLDDVLKKRKYKGKTMGERLVSAQHAIKDNDSIWFAHKLRNKLVNDELKKLKKKDVMAALLGIRAALKDLGALK